MTAKEQSGTSDQASNFIGKFWRTQEDSNLWPLPSEGSELGFVRHKFRLCSHFRPIKGQLERWKRDRNGTEAP